MGGAKAGEHPPRITQGMAPTDPCGDGFADIHRQGQAFDTPGFAPHDDVTRPRIDIVEVQGRDLSSTQTQTIIDTNTA